MNINSAYSILVGIAGALLLIAVRLALATIAIVPITYFVNGVDGIGAAISGVFFGGLFCLWLASELEFLNWELWLLWFTVDVVFGISYGIYIPIYQVATGAPFKYAWMVVAGLLAIALSLGWVTGIIDASRSIRTGKNMSGDIAYLRIKTLFFWAILIPATVAASSLNQIQKQDKLLIVAAGVMSWLTGMQLGQKLGKVTRVVTITGVKVGSEVKTLGAAGVFFVAGYILIAFFYSTLYAATWKLDSNSFVGSGLSNPPQLLDFVYFSVVTVATLGYGDIVPKLPLARIAVMSEVILGFTWMTLVMSAVVARLTSRPLEACIMKEEPSSADQSSSQPAAADGQAAAP